MYKKDKGQTQATKWKRKTKDKHRQYNVPKRQRTNTGHTMYKKEKGQTQAIQWTKMKRTNTGHTMYKKDKGQTQTIQ
jgi:hypothetical protein